MRILILFFISFLTTNLVAGAGDTYTSKTGGDGDWNNSANWVGGNIPPATLGNSDILQIVSGTTITLPSALVTGNGTELQIAGKLIVNGNLQIDQNNLILTIDLGAELHVKGDFEAQNNMTVDVEGTLKVDGDLVAKNGADIEINGDGLIDGNIDLEGNSSLTFNGYGEVDGDITMGNNNDSGGTASLEINGHTDVYGDITVTGGTDILLDGKLNLYGSMVGDATGDNELWGSGNIYITGSYVEFDTSNFNGNTSGVPLPVVLSFFTTEYNNGLVKINWRTESEYNNDYFEVFKQEGDVWESVVIVEGKNSMSTASDYVVYDNQSDGAECYKLEQTDYDGTTAVLGVNCLPAEKSHLANVTIFPNPATDWIKVEGRDIVSATLFSDDKQHIKAADVLEEVFAEFDLEGCAKGHYILQVVTETGLEVFSILIK